MVGAAVLVHESAMRVLGHAPLGRRSRGGCVLNLGSNKPVISDLLPKAA